MEGTCSMVSIRVMVFPVPGGPNSTYGLGRHSPARILFTASLWGGFRSGLKKCPRLGIGLDGRLPPGGDLTLKISVLCERQRQSLNQTESPALVPLVCVAFDFMSMEMLSTFSFPTAAAWDSGIGLILKKLDRKFVFCSPFLPHFHPLRCFGLAPQSTFLSTERAEESL